MKRLRKISTLAICVHIFILCGICSQALAENETKFVHIVMIWLKEPGNQKHITEVIKATKSLNEIQVVNELRVGQSISSDRPIVDDSFDVALYMIFNSEDDLERYLVHPMHMNVVENILRPLANKVLVYDFKDVES